MNVSDRTLKKLFLAVLASILTTSLMMYCSKKRTKRQPSKPDFDYAASETLPEFQKAIDSVILTDPRTVKEFPPELLFAMEREKCKIPHAKNDPNRAGWIKGHFYKATQTDYAVLCMTPQKEMTIKIFWGDERPCSVSLGYGMSKKYILPEGDHEFAYARSLLKAGAQRLAYYVYYAKFAKPQDGQEGIEDNLIGQGSIIHYCLDGKWHPVRTR